LEDREDAVSEFGRTLVAQFDSEDLELLAGRVGNLLAVREQGLAVPLYTPATLAAELGRSDRSIRAAITRGELKAVKRGRGWVISAQAVAEWTRVRRAERAASLGKPRVRSTRGPVHRALHQ
jgi:excisionase family DNA binding protein